MKELAFFHIEPAEYFRKFLEYNIRPDGRHLTDTRNIKIRRNVLSDSTIGSALVSADRSRFVAGVTAEIGVPHPCAPNAGRVVVNVEFPRSCGADIDANPSLATQPRVILGQILSSSSVIDLSQFCIKEGHTVWILYVNVLCIEYDGNSIDWGLTSAVSALLSSKLSSLEWCPRKQWWRESNAATSANSWEGRDVQLKARPTSLTSSRLLNKYWVTDPTAREEVFGQSVTVWRAGANSSPNMFRQLGLPLDVSAIYASIAAATTMGLSAREADVERAEEQERKEEEENIAWIVCTEEEEDSEEERDNMGDTSATRHNSREFFL